MQEDLDDTIEESMNIGHHEGDKSDKDYINRHR